MKPLKALTIVLIPLLLAFCNSKENKVSAQETSDSKAKVTIVEYSDYQCPACAQYHPLMKKLKQDFGSDLNIEYRYFPLNMHQYAALAARAAEAAKKQGKFLDMHNILFENQEKWANESNPQAEFINYARQLDLDVDKFKEDLNAAKTQQTVMEQKKAGEREGVSATPTFYINGTKVNELPRSYQEFKYMVELYMEEAEKEN